MTEVVVESTTFFTFLYFIKIFMQLVATEAVGYMGVVLHIIWDNTDKVHPLLVRATSKKNKY
jgi:hypothetical protein